jgi:hypothetical protein
MRTVGKSIAKSGENAGAATTQPMARTDLETAAIVRGLVGLLATTLGACAQPGVHLTITAGYSLTDANVAAIRNLGLVVTGSETLHTTVTLGRPFAASREERLIYVPLSKSTLVHLFVAGLDSANNQLAVGEADANPLPGKSVDAHVILEASSMQLPDAGADSGSSAPADMKSMSGVDLAGKPDLAGVVLPANAGDTCAVAPVLPFGVDVPNQDTTPLHNDYDPASGKSAACSNATDHSYPGRDGAYQVVIPAHHQLTVTLTCPNFSPGNLFFCPLIFLVTDCNQAGPSCVAASQYNPKVCCNVSVQYANPGGNSVSTYLIVDNYSADGYGAFQLRADLN